MPYRRIPAAIACAVALTTTSALAQNPIPNAGFENWVGGEPVGWYTTNAAAPGGVTQSTDAHSGNYAIRSQFVEIFPGVPFPASYQVGDTNIGFAVSERYGSLHGFVKFNRLTDEVFYISITMLADGAFIGAASYQDSTASSVYREFVAPINYFSPGTPDSVFLSAGLTTNTNDYSLESFLLLDDLEFSLDSGQASCPVALTGDVDFNGGVITSDIIYLVNNVLKGGGDPMPCVAAGDVNCDGQVVTSDIIYLVNYVLKGGPLPCDVCTIIPATWSCP